MTQFDSHFPQSSAIRGLIDEFRGGSAEAGEKLWNMYGILVRQAVRSRLPRKLRNVFDSEDFTQQVWASFFHEPEHLPAFERPEQLVAYLRSMAHHKVIQECRKRLSGVRRNEKQIRSLDSASMEHETPVQKSVPTPSQAFIEKELLARLVADAPELHRRIVQMRCNGLTYKEIGSILDLHENSVRRILSSLYRRMME